MAILAGGFSIGLGRWNTDRRLWLALLIGINLSIATFLLRQALIAQQSARIEQTTKLHTMQIASEISGQIKTRIRALVRMADRWQLRGKTPHREWLADASNYLKDHPGYQAIEWADPNFYVRWMVPLAGNEAAQNLNLTFEERRRSSLEAALNRHEVRVTHSLKLVQGGNGFRVYVPLFPQDKFDGFIVGVFRTQKLLDTIADTLESQQTNKLGYSIAIYDGEEKIYHRHPNNRLEENKGERGKWVQETTITVDGVTWLLRVWPNLDMIAAEQSPLPNALLIGGLLTSWLLALAVYLLQMVYVHAKATQVANQELQRQICDRSRTEEALSRLSHKNELILNSVSEGIVGLDQHLRIAFVNSAAAKMLGYPVEEVISLPMQAIICQPPTGVGAVGVCEAFVSPNLCVCGDSLSAQTLLSADDSELCCPLAQCSIWRTLEEGSVHHVSNQVFWRKNKTSLPVEYVSTPILENGKILGAVVVFKDISDRHAIEKMKDQFISVVSHELRTPLTSIRGAVGLLAGGLLSARPEKAQRMLEIAIANTERLGHLIENILDLQRIESGEISLNKQFCNAANLMVHAANEMQSMARKAGVKLSVMPVDAPLWAEPNLLQQTLTNLLSNAIKFSPPGTTVWLAGDCRGEQIVFKVQDQGRGIPPDRLQMIFERFQQVDASDSRAFGGTGLGLAICRCIVLQHGGRIWAESHPGVGSTFFFSLPILKELPVMEKVLTH